MISHSSSETFYFVEEINRYIDEACTHSYTPACRTVETLSRAVKSALLLHRVPTAAVFMPERGSTYLYLYTHTQQRREDKGETY